MRSLLLPMMVLGVLATAAPARADDPLVEKVRRSIEDGKRYLLNTQKEDGSWERDNLAPTQPGGQTSLAVLALLAVGMDAEAKPLQNGLKYLRRVNPTQTYVVALHTMAFAQANQAVDRERIRKNVEWLLAARQKDGWSYNRRSGGTDNSNTHYALMGLDAARTEGVEVDNKALAEIHRFYLQTQTDGGGWVYRLKDKPPYLSMTAAGLCGLLLSRRGPDGQEKLRDDGSAERCGIRDDRDAETKALRWIGEHFPAEIPRENVQKRFTLAPFYGLHALADASRLTGRRYFGERDWYEIGSRWLIGTQDSNGSWHLDNALDGSPVVATSFAVLFLVHGRTPVLIAKLAYGPREYDGWDNTSGDARHLVEFTGRELFKKRPLAWQVFDVRGRDGEKEEVRKWAVALREAPIVYFNGHEFAPRDREEAILKEYLANGGYVLAEACCGDKRFDKDFRTLMKRLYPDAELKPLPADHPVWKAAGKFTLAPNDWPLLGIEHKGRTVVIYSPKPLAGYWQAGQFDRGRGQLAFRVGASIVAYATGLKPPPPRGSAAK